MSGRAGYRNLGVARPGRPDWLQQLWHYDPHYAYDWERYVYGAWSTTEHYIEEDVQVLSPLPIHGAFLSQAENNLQRFCALVQDFPLTREAPVFRLPPAPSLPVLTHSRHRVEPDLALWPPGTRIQAAASLYWRPDCTPGLVRACLSATTASKDREDNPAIYRVIGVREYWLCDPQDKGMLEGYHRSRPGLPWTRVAKTTAPVYSGFLQTWLRNHPEQARPMPGSSECAGLVLAVSGRYFRCGRRTRR